MDNKVPDLYVFSPDKRLCYGAVQTEIEMTKDVRFNTLSEMSFKVPEKICDPITGEWVKNPIYDHLKKYNLLYSCDDKKYFRFPIKRIRDDYGIKNTSQFALSYGRNVQTNAAVTYENIKDNGSNNGVLTGFSLQPETDLRHISVVGGYPWWNLATIESWGLQRNPQNWNLYMNVACDTFVPIDIYDVIAVKTRSGTSQDGSSVRYYYYCINFYDSSDANHLLGYLYIYSGYTHDGNNVDTNTSHTTTANPVFRFNINSLTVSDNLYYINSNLGVDNNDSNEIKLAALKKKMQENGYIRIDVCDSYADSSASIETKRQYSSYKYTDNGVTVMGWSFPYDGWCVVYSGNRFCKEIENTNETGYYELPLHWFVINDVEEEYDGNIKIKTVSAYSYEYTTSYRTISLSEDTIPLYTPPQILNIVNGDSWVIDKVSGSSQVRKSRQYIAEGLLNQVLRILPNWSIGHISSELMTRYRRVSDVDNANIYNFLMNDIESLYQCYFVFDGDNETISAYTQEDIINNNYQGIILNWRNALKSLTVTDIDDSALTMMRVHTADDTYGLGLVIPTGNGNIYNFQSVLDRMDFVADDSDNDPLQRNKITEDGVTRNRTLKEAAESLMEFCENPMVNSSGWLPVNMTTHVGDGDTDLNVYGRTVIYIRNINEYRNIAEKFITLNLERIKCESSLSTYYSNYQSVLNKIEIRAEYENVVNYYNSEAIRKPSELQNYHNQSANVGVFVNESLYQELYNASVDYHKARAEYEAKNNDYKQYLYALKTMAASYNLDYDKQVYLTNLRRSSAYDSDGNYIMLSLLTPKEIKAIYSYLREGDWTNDNSVFSEDYDAKDIISTLVDVYNQAKTDMDNFISKINYDFETSIVNWSTIPEMKKMYENLKVGETLFLNTENNKYVIPLLLELHVNYFD